MAEIKRISITEQDRYASVREDILDLEAKKEARLFSFDPNTLPQSGWETLGLSPKQAKSIVNYTSKGGRFYQPEDLKKMYTISPDMYIKLLPYVKIADKGNSHKSLVFERKEFAKKVSVIVDINRADSVQLDAVKGIGPAFAKRILKYRERLGGFYKKEQLLEVYGLDSAKYAEIKDQLILSKIDLNTVNINTATFNELRTNPYLSYKQINAILQYRKQHGDYTSKEDLRKIVILNPELIEKILPYISFK
ncbi:ComEA family DNA-binding protein [Pedobacter rhizosphaerae]|nr:helix-hairpin-helix domain-containing protein [Pedobacter rhizosphaerae]